MPFFKPLYFPEKSTLVELKVENYTSNALLYSRSIKFRNWENTLSPSIFMTIEENKEIIQCTPAPYALLVQDHLIEYGKLGHSGINVLIPGVLIAVFVKLEVRKTVRWQQ